MRYTRKGSPSTVSHFTAERSVAETLLETLTETLGQGGLRPDLDRRADGRRRRARRIAGVLAMLASLATLGFVSLAPASDPASAAGEPVAYLQIARGQAEISGGGRATPSNLLMLAGGEPIHAGTVLETGSAAGGTQPASAQPASRVALRLAGGQAVRLDSGSRIRFSSRSQMMLERGAVYVDSAGGDHVEVRTALGVVRDIGTRFEVRLLDAARSLQVRVREGSVELERDGDRHLAVAGEQLRVRADGRIERDASPICGRHWAWVQEIAPVPDVTGRPLADFLDWAAQEACWTVRFTDQAIAGIAAETILHGDVRDLTLTEAASMAVHGSGLAYRLVDGVFTVGPRSEDS